MFIGVQLTVRERDFTSESRGEKAISVLLTDTNRWPTPARLAIGLSQAGCCVSAVCPSSHPLMYTRAVQRVFPYRSLRPLESLLTAIEATNPQIVIPCDDRGVQHLHELFAHACSRGAAGRKIADLIERSIGSPESYRITASRYELLRVAREEGIRLPATILIRTVDDFKTWQTDQVFPWVLKADGSFGGRGVKIARSREEAEHLFLQMSRPERTARVIKRLIVNRDPFWVRPWWNRCRPAVIAQTYIHGRPANCAVVCWDGKVLAGICVEVLSSEGATGPASIVRAVDSPEMMVAAQRISSRLGLSGFFGLDFMIEEESRAIHLIEMNPRSTPACHLQLGRGRDLIGAFWSQLSGEAFRERPPITQKDVIAYFPQAWTSKSNLLSSSFQDIPRGEPSLVQELLRPWPERSILYRLGHALTAAVSTQKSSN
jgi:hypothetical protein